MPVTSALDPVRGELQNSDGSSSERPLSVCPPSLTHRHLSPDSSDSSHRLSHRLSLGPKSNMSLQWALVATFLYVEIGFIILLLLPIISPRTYVISIAFVTDIIM